jgi:hypothetical protein
MSAIEIFQPLKEQRATRCITPKTAADFFNGQPKRPDNQNFSRFSSTLDWCRSLRRSNVQSRAESLFEKPEFVFERGFGEKCLENPMILSLK